MSIVAKNINALKVFCCTCFLFLAGTSSQAQLLINEVSSSNEFAIADEFGDYPDWIECYNGTTTAINLEGYFLTDNPENKSKWVFPSVTIPAESFLIVFASGEEAGNLHTSFKLARAGEYIGLFDPNGELVDETAIPELYEDVSYARLPNSGNFIYAENPTPGSPNVSAQIIDISATPIFFTTTSISPDPIDVFIEGDGKVYYTLDGSLPDENDFLYEDKINITTSAVIRARSFALNKLPSTISSISILVDVDHELPIVTLITEPENLWDEEEGILVDGPNADTIFPFYGANYWLDKSIPVELNYYDSNQEFQFAQKVKAEVHGGRGARTKPQKPLRLTASKLYGPEFFNYRFFDYRQQDKFKSIVLRNSSGDWGYAHMRDAYLSAYFEKEGMDIEVPGHQPCVVYLNAEYYGIMHIRDKVDEFFLAEKNGGLAENIEILESDSLAIEGNFDTFLEMLNYVNSNDLSSQVAFDSAASFFDVYEIAEYFILQTAINNFDWPGNNIKYWREQKEGEKWRYILFDLDGCCGRYPWSKAKFNSIGTRFEQFPHVSLIQLLTAFFQNEDYRNYFINRYADILNSSLRSEEVIAETEAAAERISKDLRVHLRHWSEVGFDTWRDDRIPELIEFFEERPDFVREELKSFFDLQSTFEIQLEVYPPAIGADKLKINTLSLPRSWEGIYFKGVPISVEVSSVPGFTFSHWQTSQLLANPESPSFTQSFGDDVVALTAVFTKGEDIETLLVYPNPTLEYVQLVLPKNFDFKSMTLSNSLGKEMFTTDVLVGRIDVADLKTGVYFLTVTDMAGEKISKPILVGARR